MIPNTSANAEHFDDSVAPSATTPPPDPFIRDMVIVWVIALLTFTFAAVVELNEWILLHTRHLEFYQLDELPIALLVGMIVLTWLSWRRWNQLSTEYRLRLRVQHALADSVVENRRLARKHMLAQEEERRTLAHEIHDEMGQSLNAIKLDAVAIRQRRWSTLDEMDACADSIIELSNRLHETVRDLSRRLRPVALDELGLCDALELYVSHWERRNAPVECSFEAHGESNDLGELLNITLYRCVQESLTNITRHAGATRVSVLVEMDANGIRLVIADNGRGMDSHSKNQGLGLVGLRERAKAHGGSLNIQSAPGAGMRIVLSVPLPETNGLR